MSQNLLTKAEYDKLTPFQQGYVIYMQAEWPGSELKGLDCHYPAGSKEDIQWHDGQLRATLSVMDSEE
jgi:hypothetical protein